MTSNSGTPAPVASNHDEAKTAMHYVNKERETLNKHLNKARANTSGTDLAQFDRIDESIARFRFNCVSVIFLDFEYAVSRDVEDGLWAMHMEVNKHFRETLAKLRPEKRPVEQRKVEAKQGHFLRISQKFYKGFIKQLSQVYIVPGLRRIAKEIDAEGSNEHSITPSPELAEKILSSCHITLIRLGDLSRYRVEAKSSKTYGSALVCYSLAHDLMPDSGHAFNQLALINSKEGNDLEIIYNFYRSVAVNDPPPEAKQNLNRQFDKVGKMKDSKRGRTPPSASEALVEWFVKLHAVYHKGEAIDDKHVALEREVMHRLSIAVKDPSFGILLLKMALINISASYIAFTEHTANATEKTSNFYKYTLHFNARFLHQICEAIGEDARATSHQSPDVAGANEDQASITESLLPILRVYSMWIASQGSELFTSASSPSHVIPHMTRSLARVMTIFCAAIYDAGVDGLASCPYLLPEDREIRGLVPLKEDQVPHAAQGYTGEGGTLKPYMVNSEKWTTAREYRGRMLDILRCAYFLTSEPEVPITFEQKGSDFEFQYQEIQRSTQSPVARVTPTAAPPAKANGAAFPMLAPQPETHASEEPAQPMPSPQKQITTSANMRQAQEMEQTHETTMDMLTDFLDSPVTDAERTKQSSGEPSYGMHDSTANALAHELLQSFRDKEETLPYYQAVSPGSFASPPFGPYLNPASPNTQASRAAGQSAQWASHRRTDSGRSIPAVRTEAPLATPRRDAFGMQTNVAKAIRSPQVSSPVSIGGTSQLQASTLNESYTHSSPRSASQNWQQDYRVPGGLQPRSQDHTMLPPGSIPFSSNASAFSDLSSVYQGTPANGLRYELPTRGQPQQQKQTPQPASYSNPSAFSNMSSGYQGTPANGSGYDARGIPQQQKQTPQPASSAFPMYGQRQGKVSPQYYESGNSMYQSQNTASPTATSPYARDGQYGTQWQNSASQAAASSFPMYGNSGNSPQQLGASQGATSSAYSSKNSASNYDRQIFEGAMRDNYK